MSVPTSQSFHMRLLDDAEFRAGKTDIAFLERAGERLQRRGGSSERARTEPPR